jgi:pimeloyl-ACP methyl ester carboxylesterase
MIAPEAAPFCTQSNLSYTVAGSGERSLLLLHGWADSRAIWRLTIDALAQERRVFAPDLPGHGDSPLNGAVAMRAMAERVAAFCDARGAGEFAVLGHSMGGNVALELALQRPDLVRRLVLVAPAVHGGALPFARSAHLLRPYGWVALRVFLAGTPLLGRLGGMLANDTALPGPMSMLRRARYNQRREPEILTRILDSLIANPLIERLGELNIPTLVVSGALDTVVPATFTRQVAAAIPGAKLALMPTAMHHPMDETPRAFSRIVDRWLRESGW